MRAERRAGQLLKESKAAAQRHAAGGDQKSKSSNSTLIPTLKDIGITKTQSADWQKIAEIPDEQFEHLVTQHGMTTGNLVAAARPKPAPIQVDPDALWIWGTLGDLVRRGLLKRSFAAMVKEMPFNMRADCEKWAPTIREWLEEPA
jgi:hypothetical protein